MEELMIDTLLGREAELKIRSKGSVIFTEPFVDKGTETVIAGGFVKIAQKHGLSQLKVVFGNSEFTEDSYVYVRSETFKQKWASEKFTLFDKEVIAVPIDQILLHSNKPIINE
jgi:hypothetical protein